MYIPSRWGSWQNRWGWDHRCTRGDNGRSQQWIQGLSWQGCTGRNAQKSTHYYSVWNLLQKCSKVSSLLQCVEFTRHWCLDLEFVGKGSLFPNKVSESEGQQSHAAYIYEYIYKYMYISHPHMYKNTFTNMYIIICIYIYNNVCIYI